MSTRIPHLGHAALFLVLTVIALLASEGVVMATNPHHPLVALMDPRLQLLANILTYLLALAAAWFIFPLLWHRSFPAGLDWNGSAARPYLVGVGLAVGFASQAVTSLMPTPGKLPIEELFHNPALIWILAIFGTLVAPLFEEVIFRGFLLPGFAIAVDFLRLPKDPEAYADWRASGSFSAPALVTASVITSLLFALIHAPQLGYTWPAVSLLAAVSLVLCAIRLRTRSVAASTLVHATYNFSVFLTIFVTTHGFRHLERA